MEEFCFQLPLQYVIVKKKKKKKNRPFKEREPKGLLTMISKILLLNSLLT